MISKAFSYCCHFKKNVSSDLPSANLLRYFQCKQYITRKKIELGTKKEKYKQAGYNVS